jgi:hypothetical protein
MCKKEFRLEKVEEVALGINLMDIIQCSFHIV